MDKGMLLAQMRPIISIEILKSDLRFHSTFFSNSFFFRNCGPFKLVPNDYLDLA